MQQINDRIVRISLQYVDRKNKIYKFKEKRLYNLKNELNMLKNSK